MLFHRDPSKRCESMDRAKTSLFFEDGLFEPAELRVTMVRTAPSDIRDARSLLRCASGASTWGSASTSQPRQHLAPRARTVGANRGRRRVGIRMARASHVVVALRVDNL